MTSVIPDDAGYTCGSMAERKPYQFEPIVATSYINDKSDSDELDTNV